MSTKVRYISPAQAPKVKVALDAQGYVVTAEECTGYAISVIDRVDRHHPRLIQTVIDNALDGEAFDSEGFPIELGSPDDR